jgi:hypothetical protein
VNAVDKDAAQISFANSLSEDVRGYSSMSGACTDIVDVVNVVWVSGTPGLQIPYLINLALLLSTVVASMPVQPKPLFRCLGVLDACFASLIQGRDVETGEALPGFAGSSSAGSEGGSRLRRKGVSDTEKVRIRSLVERTRVAVVEAFKRGEVDVSDDTQRAAVSEDTDMDDGDGLVLEGEALDTEGEDDAEEDGLGSGGASWDMQVARVYDRTVQELGDALEGPGIGVLTERGG